DVGEHHEVEGVRYGISGKYWLRQLWDTCGSTSLSRGGGTGPCRSRLRARFRVRLRQAWVYPVLQQPTPELRLPHAVGPQSVHALLQQVLVRRPPQTKTQLVRDGQKHVPRAARAEDGLHHWLLHTQCRHAVRNRIT